MEKSSPRAVFFFADTLSAPRKISFFLLVNVKMARRVIFYLNENRNAKRASFSSSIGLGMVRTYSKWRA